MAIAEGSEIEWANPHIGRDALVQRLAKLVASRYNTGQITQISPLTGGEWKTIFRITSKNGPLVLSIYHPSTTVESIEYEHALLRYLQPRLPQVPAPLIAVDGSSYFLDQGRFASVFPLMPGIPAKRETSRVPAARFLAEFQRVALTYPDHAARPHVPAWNAWDWGEPVWPAIQAQLASSPDRVTGATQRFWQEGGEWAQQIVAHRTQVQEERTHFQQWLAALPQTVPTLAFGLVHDDYYQNNLLIEGGTIRALLDWDGCHPDWMILDLATAVWEFCLDRSAHTLDVRHARTFLEEYQAAGGPISTQEFALILPFIRCRRIIEVISALQGVITGETWNEGHAEYMVHNLISLENLQNVTL
jgi:Ser/Thr protein kinase RdoA (MazF antagonist)